MPKGPVMRQGPKTGGQRPILPSILLDDAPGGLKAGDSGVLSVGVEDSRTGDVGTINGQGDGGLTGAQGGDRRDTHDCFGISPTLASGMLGAGGPRALTSPAPPFQPSTQCQSRTERALPTSQTGTRHLSQSL